MLANTPPYHVPIVGGPSHGVSAVARPYMCGAHNARSEDGVLKYDLFPYALVRIRKGDSYDKWMFRPAANLAVNQGR